MKQKHEHRIQCQLFFVVCDLFAGCAIAQTLVPDALNTDPLPRERISINADWRFHQSDPEGLATNRDLDPARQRGERRRPDSR